MIDTTVPMTRIDAQPSQDGYELTVSVFRSSTFLVIRKPDGTWDQYDIDRADWDAIAEATAERHAQFATENEEETENPLLEAARHGQALNEPVHVTQVTDPEPEPGS